MRDVVVLEKIRGLKINVGEYIEYDPASESYYYFKEEISDKDVFVKANSVYYDFPVEYISEMVKLEKFSYVGEDVELDPEVSEINERAKTKIDCMLEDIEIERKRVDEYFSNISDNLNAFNRLLMSW